MMHQGTQSECKDVIDQASNAVQLLDERDQEKVIV